MEIEKHLKNYGYNLSFSLDDDLCSRELGKYLGKKKYLEFGSYVDNMIEMFGPHQIENIIRDYIGNDEKFLKILLSGQIIISVSILKEIIKSIERDFKESNDKLNILELGGYDGWSSDYIDLSINKSISIDIVDNTILKKKFNPNLKYIKSDYNLYNSDNKYDIIFSILGIEYVNIQSLINCIDRNIKINGCVYLGLRVQPDDYSKIIENFKELGFKETEKDLKTIKVVKDTGVESFPLFEFKKIR